MKYFDSTHDSLRTKVRRSQVPRAQHGAPPARQSCGNQAVARQPFGPARALHRIVRLPGRSRRARGPPDENPPRAAPPLRDRPSHPENDESRRESRPVPASRAVLWRIEDKLLRQRRSLFRVTDATENLPTLGYQLDELYSTGDARDSPPGLPCQTMICALRFRSAIAPSVVRTISPPAATAISAISLLSGERSSFASGDLGDKRSNPFRTGLQLWRDRIWGREVWEGSGRGTVAWSAPSRTGVSPLPMISVKSESIASSLSERPPHVACGRSASIARSISKQPSSLNGFVTSTTIKSGSRNSARGWAPSSPSGGRSSHRGCRKRRGSRSAGRDTCQGKPAQGRRRLRCCRGRESRGRG